MKRVMLLCLLSMACGPQEEQADEQGTNQAPLGALPPVVNCAKYGSEADCNIASVACTWRAVPCPLAVSSSGGPTTCIPFACVPKDPGPIQCGTVSADGTQAVVPCGGPSMGGPTTGGSIPASPVH